MMFGHVHSVNGSIIFMSQSHIPDQNIKTLKTQKSYINFFPNNTNVNSLKIFGFVKIHITEKAMTS